MGYAELLLSPALQPLVACAWAISGPANEHRVLPDGCIDILVVGGVGASVVGTMRRAIVAPAHEGTVVGIRFRPGEAARLLRAAPRELTDLDAPLDALWGDDGRRLEAALMKLLERADAASHDAGEVLAQSRETIEAALRSRLAAYGEAVDVRVRAAAEHLANGETVRDVAERVALSERQLARRFTDRVGVAPKVFARVKRLQRAAALLAEGIAPAHASSLAGYADQAHFTRDAVDLGGITPAGLAREVSDSFKTVVAIAS